MPATVLAYAAPLAKARLREAGFTVITQGPSPHDAVVVDDDGRTVLEAQSLANMARGRSAIPVIALGDSLASAIGFDAVAPADAPPALLRARIEQALRIAALEEEAGVRGTALGAFGLAAPSTWRIDPTPAPPRVLVVGSPSRHLIALSGALEALGAEVGASLTTFTAFDYLHDATFDACAICGIDDVETASAFISTLRRNAALYHLPCAAVLADIEASGLMFERGADEVIMTREAPEPSAQRLLRLAQVRRRREAARQRFARMRLPPVVDTASGLHTAAFMAACIDARRVLRPEAAQAIGVLRLVEDGGAAALRRFGALDNALAQAGAMADRLVRAEDLAARLDETTFAVLTAVGGRAAADAAARRIAAVLECSAWPTGETGRPASLAFACAACEITSDANGAAFVERARRLLETRGA